MSDNREPDVLEELFHHAKPRVRPPEAVANELREKLHAEWLEVVRARRRRRSITLALAASVLVGLFVGTLFFTRLPSPDVAVTVASIERLHGQNVRWSEADSGNFRTIAETHLVKTGQIVNTGADSRIAFEFRRGGSLRLDENTSMHVLGPELIVLKRGRLYFDSAGVNDIRLVVRTAFGDISHYGTQFMVGVTNKHADVTVREGEVIFETERGSKSVEVGERVTAFVGGHVEPASVATFGLLWDWTETISPGLPENDVTIFRFLEWVARETGREVVYLGAARAEAINNTMHSVAGVAPMTALRTLEGTSHLTYIIKDGQIQIRTTGP